MNDWKKDLKEIGRIFGVIAALILLATIVGYAITQIWGDNVRSAFFTMFVCSGIVCAGIPLTHKFGILPGDKDASPSPAAIFLTIWVLIMAGTGSSVLDEYDHENWRAEVYLEWLREGRNVINPQALRSNSPKVKISLPRPPSESGLVYPPDELPDD